MFAALLAWRRRATEYNPRHSASAIAAATAYPNQAGAYDDHHIGQNTEELRPRPPQ